MIKILKGFLIITIVIPILTGCSYSQDNTYDELIVDYFETTDYEYVNNTITVTVNGNETNEDLIAKGKLLLGSYEFQMLDGESTNVKLIIYNKQNISLVMIVLFKHFIDENTYTIKCLEIDYDNLKEN